MYSPTAVASIKDLEIEDNKAMVHTEKSYNLLLVYEASVMHVNSELKNMVSKSVPQLCDALYTCKLRAANMVSESVPQPTTENFDLGPSGLAPLPTHPKTVFHPFEV